MPSSLATSATERFNGGNNFFNTADLLSSEYPITAQLNPPSVSASANSAGATTILTPGDRVTDEDVEFAVNRLNTRPRKCLDWQTPQQAFHAAAKKQGVALRT